MLASPWNAGKPRPVIQARSLKCTKSIEEVHKQTEELVHKVSEELAKLRRTASTASNNLLSNSSSQSAAAPLNNTLSLPVLPPHQGGSFKDLSVRSPFAPSRASSPKIRIATEHILIPMVVSEQASSQAESVPSLALNAETTCSLGLTDKKEVKKGNVHRLKAMFENRNSNKNSKPAAWNSSTRTTRHSASEASVASSGWDASTGRQKKERRNLLWNWKVKTLPSSPAPAPAISDDAPSTASPSTLSTPMSPKSTIPSSLTFQAATTRSVETPLPETPKFGNFPSATKQLATGSTLQFPQLMHHDDSPETPKITGIPSLPSNSSIQQQQQSELRIAAAIHGGPSQTSRSKTNTSKQTMPARTTQRPANAPYKKLPEQQRTTSNLADTTHTNDRNAGSILGKPAAGELQNPPKSQKTPLTIRPNVPSHGYGGSATSSNCTTPRSPKFATTKRFGPPKHLTSYRHGSSSSGSSRASSNRDAARITADQRGSRPTWNSSSKVIDPAAQQTPPAPRPQLIIPQRRVKAIARSMDTRSSGASTPSTVIRKSGVSSFGSFDSLLSLQETETDSVAHGSEAGSSYRKQEYRLKEVRRETPLTHQIRQTLTETLPHLKDAGLDQPPPPVVPTLPPLPPGDRSLSRQASKPVLVRQPRKHKSKKRVSWDESSISNTPSRSRSWDEHSFEESRAEMQQPTEPPQDAESACSDFYDIVFDLHNQMSNQAGDGVPPEVQAARITKAVSKKLEQTISMALRDASARYLAERHGDAPSPSTERNYNVNTAQLPTRGVQPRNHEPQTSDSRINSDDVEVSSNQLEKIATPPPLRSSKSEKSVSESPRTPSSVPTINDIQPVKPMALEETQLSGREGPASDGVAQSMPKKEGSRPMPVITAIATSQMQLPPKQQQNSTVQPQEPPRQITLQAFTGTPKQVAQPSPVKTTVDPPPPETKKKFSRLKKFWSEVFA